MRKTKKLLCILVATVFLMTLFSACGGNNAPETKEQTNAADNSSAAQAKTEETKAPEPVELSVAFNATAFSEEMFTALFDGFQKAYPNIKLKTEVNNKLEEALTPRVVSGDMPDVIYAGLPNLYELISEGKLMDLTDFYKSKAYDSDKTVGETLVSGCSEAVVLNGKPYAIAVSPAYAGAVVNESLFVENGWKIPTTYTEFKDAAEKMKVKGITPLAYNALAPENRLEMCLFNGGVYEYGGAEALRALDNLEPGAWKSEPVVKTLQVIKDMLDQKYITKDGLGMNGTQTQTGFLNGKYGMVLSGFWFEMEMKDQMKADTKLTIIPFPVTDNQKKGLLSWYNTIYAWNATKQPAAAQDFLRYVLSYEFQKKLGTDGGLTLLANKQAMDELKNDAKTSYFTKKVIEAATDPNNSLIPGQYMWWYSPLRVVIQDQIRAVLNGDSPEKAAQAIEDAAEKIRNDSSITKYKR